MSAIKKCGGLMAIGLSALLVSAWLVTPAEATVLTMNVDNAGTTSLATVVLVRLMASTVTVAGSLTRPPTKTTLPAV